MMWPVILPLLALSSSRGALSFRTPSPPLAASSSSSSSVRGGGPHRRPPPSPALVASRPLSSSTRVIRSSSSDAEGGADNECDCPTTIPPPPPPSDDDGGPAPLQPYLPAFDPKYPVRGPVGGGKFVLDRRGPPSIEELSNDNMLLIVRSECTDLEVNTLVWKCLGYRFDEEAERWDDAEVFPRWRENYPDPPDLIGMRRVYSREVDSPSLKSNQSLVRSIPQENKQSLKTHLKPLGWKGYQYKELTPNKTRRAQCANWLIFYREELFGYTVEELTERRRIKREAEDAAAAEARRIIDEGGEGREAAADEWKPPVKEVF
ncbi:hypothetical protein ACHAW5_003651 [Stephanodiscus triporus]|uniref:AP2/ERF domain-containing protein n=1 Tax=Stephanodiscus triporus TaxID=2934178 RepID=A0ABD3NVF1_9STRA